ncbi:hypothetical protein BHE74_00027762 [Ensete ventricosum]|nr:hypothetical protein BHE74_00027762 [Ensete ventricosum]RZR80025.1 hypothetical protein BHM03_00005916 [Ensete ventricosum]
MTISVLVRGSSPSVARRVVVPRAPNVGVVLQRGVMNQPGEVVLMRKLVSVYLTVLRTELPGIPGSSDGTVFVQPSRKPPIVSRTIGQSAHRAFWLSLPR